MAKPIALRYHNGDMEKFAKSEVMTWTAYYTEENITVRIEETQDE